MIRDQLEDRSLGVVQTLDDQVDAGVIDHSTRDNAGRRRARSLGFAAGGRWRRCRSFVLFSARCVHRVVAQREPDLFEIGVLRGLPGGLLGTAAGSERGQERGQTDENRPDDPCAMTLFRRQMIGPHEVTP